MQQTATSANDANDDIHALYRRARAAFEEYRTWPQEKVDLVCQAVGYELSKPDTAEALARLAVDESGIGVFEDKFHKVQNKTRGTMRDQQGARTCDLVEDDREKGIRKFAKPFGVVANVVPCTNPESTVCCIGLALLKTRNAMIVSPHPRTPGSSNLAVEHIRKALGKVGAPEDLALCIREPSHDKTRELMEHCDFAVATGGAALVKVVYEAATPCHTVGAGNVVSIIDGTADLRATAEKIVKSKCANNSASCSSENAVAVEESVYDRMVGELEAVGGYLCSTEEREKLRSFYWPDGEHLNRALVAKSATWIAEKAGLEVPEDTRFLMVVGEKVGLRGPLLGGEDLPDPDAVEVERLLGDVCAAEPDPGLLRRRPLGVAAQRARRAPRGARAAGQRGASELQHAARGGEQRELVQRAADDRYAGMRELGRQHDQRQHRLAPLPQLHVAVGADA